MKTLNLPAVIHLCIFGMVGVAGAVMIDPAGITATASSEEASVAGEYAGAKTGMQAVNGNGMDVLRDGTPYQDSDYQAKWISDGLADQWLLVDLGTEYEVEDIEIWNFFHLDYTPHRDRGIRQADISYASSTNGPWTLAVNDLPVADAQFEDLDGRWVAYNHTDYYLGQSARYIKFHDLRGHNGSGANDLAIGEIRFYAPLHTKPAATTPRPVDGETGAVLSCPTGAAAASGPAPSNGAAGVAPSTLLRRTPTSRGAHFCVAPDAAPGGDGSPAAPFRTLAEARDAVRADRRTVVLRGGVYELTSPLSLSASDSGQPGDPVIYRSYSGETARLMGGTRLSTALFQPVTSDSPVWSRLDVAARGHILQISLPVAGVTDYGTLTERSVRNDRAGALMLYFEGKGMTLARWPDREPGGSPADHGGDWALAGYDLIETRISDTQFTTLSDRLNRWSGATGIWAHGYFAKNWADYHVPVADVDAATGTITLGQVPGHGVVAGQHYFVYNLPEEITEPGEWYLDRSDGMLYFWPPSDISLAEVYVSTLDDGPIQVNGASWVTFKNLVIEGARDELVNVSGGSHIEFEGCTLRNAGTYAAYITGTRNGITRSEIYNTGSGGVALDGGDRVQLLPGSNYVEQTSIHDFGQWQNGYRPAVKLSGVGHFVTHNEIYNSPHAAITWSGNAHVMEYNEIYNVCRFTHDMGAFYAGRDWGCRGNIIRYNFIHDMFSWVRFEDRGVHAVYLDDCLSGTEVFGNIAYNVAGMAIMHGGGRDTIVRNNIADSCGAAYIVDNRGTSRITHGVWPPDSWSLIGRVRADGIGYRSGVWASTYPELAAIPPDHPLGKTSHWTHPEGSVYSGNYSWRSPYKGSPSGVYENDRTGDPDYADIMNGYFDEHIDNRYGADPLFVDRANLDMRLQPGSPVYNVPGWQEIPFEDVGIDKPPATCYVNADTLLWSDMASETDVGKDYRMGASSDTNAVPAGAR